MIDTYFKKWKFKSIKYKSCFIIIFYFQISYDLEFQVVKFVCEIAIFIECSFKLFIEGFINISKVPEDKPELTSNCWMWHCKKVRKKIWVILGLNVWAILRRVDIPI